VPARAGRFWLRARGRAGREWRRLRGSDRPPARTSIFQLLGGRDIDAVVMLLVDAATAERVEGMVARDPSAVGVVRIGRTPAASRQNDFVPWGFRQGSALGMLEAFGGRGSTLIVTGRSGAALLRAQDTASAVMVVVLLDGHESDGDESDGDRSDETESHESDIEKHLGSDPAWSRAGADLDGKFGGALAHAVRVWQRAESSPTSEAR
jgi:hypothetical protein